MRKRLILFITLIIFAYSIPCSATSDDIFYHSMENVNRSDFAEQQAMMRRLGIVMVAQYYGVEKSGVEQGDITFDTTRAYCEYEWSQDKILDFMRAKTKEEKINILGSMKKRRLYFPTYYKGKRVTEFALGMEIDTEKDENYPMVAQDYYQLAVYDKENITKTLEKEGVVGYEILTAINYDGLLLAIAQKETESFCIVLPETDAPLEKAQALSNYSMKRILTAEDTEAMINCYNEIKNTEQIYAEDSVVFGSNGELQSAESLEIDINKENTLEKIIWVIAGGAVLLIAAAVAIALLTKKKAK